MKLHNKIQLSEASKIQDNVIQDVHVLGFESKNGYRYSKDAMVKAIALYENAPSYLNHRLVRTVEDKIGFISGISFKEDSGLWAKSLTLNPKNTQYEAVRWFAQNAPNQLGLSHSVEATLNRSEGIVTEISSVESCDLVSAPATTGGMFEGKDSDPAKIALDLALNQLLEDSREKLLNSDNFNTEIAAITEQFLEKIKGKPTMEYKDLTIEALKKERPDLVEAISKPMVEEAVKIAVATENKISEAIAKVPADKASDIFKKQIRASIADASFVESLIADRLALIKETPVTLEGKKEESHEVKELTEDQIRAAY